MATATASQVLSALLLGGLMGLIGQGVRAVVGLKKMNEAAQQQNASAADLFMASRLILSLFIGFITGVVATLALGISKLFQLDDGGIQTLLGIAASGYAGTDVIEGFALRLGGLAGGSVTNTGVTDMAIVSDKVDGISNQLANLKVDLTKSVSSSASSFLPASVASNSPGDWLSTITPAMVRLMFPATPLGNIVKNLPYVISGLRWAGLTDRPMLLMALSTIRAETEGFVPISEGVSQYNTDPGQPPFDKYEPGTPAGKSLGNTQSGDGARFKGRGYVQLTGRDNYQRIGPQIDVDLVGNPDLANDAADAGKILAQFLLNHQDKIRAALAKNDLKAARVAVNGGTHGLAPFVDAYTRGQNAIPIPPIGAAA
jgi:putative chitinase